MCLENVNRHVLFVVESLSLYSIFVCFQSDHLHSFVEMSISIFKTVYGHLFTFLFNMIKYSN